MREELKEKAKRSALNSNNIEIKYLNNDVIIWSENCDFYPKSHNHLNPIFIRPYVGRARDQIWDEIQKVELPYSSLDIDLPWSHSYGPTIIEGSMAFILEEERDSYLGFIFTRSLTDEADLLCRLDTIIYAFELGYKQGIEDGQYRVRRALDQKLSEVVDLCKV